MTGDRGTGAVRSKVHTKENECRSSSWDDGKNLELDSGDMVAQYVNVLMPPNYTLQEG